MNRNLLLLPALLLGLLLLGACDSADPDPILDNFGIGQGGATVSGGLEASFTGSAFWTMYEAQDEDDLPLFAMVVFSSTLDDFDDDNFDAVMIFGSPTRPPTGTSPLEFFDIDDMGYGGFFIRSRPTTFTMVNSDTGSMSISTSTSQRVEGTAQFSGMVISMMGAGNQTANVQTGFNAMFIDEDTLPGDWDPDARLMAERAIQLFGSVR